MLVTLTDSVTGAPADLFVVINVENCGVLGAGVGEVVGVGVGVAVALGFGVTDGFGVAVAFGMGAREGVGVVRF